MVLLASCGEEDVAKPEDPPVTPVDYTTESILIGLDRPVLVTAPLNQEGIWIVLKPGMIVFSDDDSTVTTFLDITDRVEPPNPVTGFSGLGSMAFHPNYATNGSFFVVYVDKFNFDLRVSRFRAHSGNPPVADPSSEEIFLSWDRPFGSIHDICHLEFEPSTGYLFVSVGDGTAGGLGGAERARDLRTIAGKLLRLDVDHPDQTAGTLYSIPPGNPHIGVADARPEIWASGLRNPWRFSFDSVTGDLYIAEPGLFSWEEINVEPPGTPGRDYGWPLLEGRHCLPTRCNVDSLAAVLDLTLPVYEYYHDIQTRRGCQSALVGGYVYRGRAIPQLQGEYLFADFCVGGWVKSFRYDDGWITQPRYLLNQLGLRVATNVSGFGRDGFGELYILSWWDGRVMKIVPVESGPDPN